MSRRKESGLDAVAALPWPAGLVLGVLAFMAIRYGGLLFANNTNPVISQLGKAFGSGVMEPVAWAVMLACWAAAGVSYLRARQRARLLEETHGLEGLAAMSWREFEMLVSEAFRRQGYVVEELGGSGADGGIDLILRRAGRMELVQCKQWRTRQIKVNVVREMWGLAKHHRADAVRIVGIGEFTLDAAEFAVGKPIELINGSTLLALVEQVRTATASIAASDEPLTEVPPACPSCRATMIQRRNSKTQAQFWGCSQYPRCRASRS